MKTRLPTRPTWNGVTMRRRPLSVWKGAAKTPATDDEDGEYVEDEKMMGMMRPLKVEIHRKTVSTDDIHSKFINNPKILNYLIFKVMSRTRRRRIFRRMQTMMSRSKDTCVGTSLHRFVNMDVLLWVFCISQCFSSEVWV